MRRLLLLPLLLAGCQAAGAPGAPLLAIPAAVEGLSLRAFGRTTGDAVVSLLTGEDCSIARIGRGEAYCGRDDPPAWPPQRGVADGPASLTEAQENHRIGWGGRIARALAPPAPAEGEAPGAVHPPAATPPPVAVIEPGPVAPAAAAAGAPP